ncbi:DUF2306 domain-containing protein [Pedobacter polaris]|uniref:DUF2306 domain-containing protein n=1 Tax=Pedobacter polaris TaxID=2571273 RepID=A0A4U1CWX1_9SPHI|nr:DUF2306 domain-containing protein [Pedobacter polaris]TKC12790.1 DUF2306 domain-containing protein [Pedobacter polaris]
MKKTLWILLAALSIVVGLYPGLYFMEKRFGLLKIKPSELVSDFVWHSAFYIHITLGGLALLIGWIQFNQKIRNKYITLHKQIGKIYVIAVLLSAITGFYIAFYAMGGIVAALGFISLSIIWFYTTLMAYLSIKKGNLLQHQKMMIYSYASCFAAVTLRLWIPILSTLFGNFETAYIVVAWWCWIPNLTVAYFLTKKLAKPSF